jgi:sec-independent protein translocase protein TatA
MIGDILQPTHLLFVLVVALLVLGPKRLPEAGRALGKGIRDFRMAIGGEEDRASMGTIPTEAAPPPPAPAIAPEPAAAAPADTTGAASDATADSTDAQPDEEPAKTAHPVG